MLHALDGVEGPQIPRLLQGYRWSTLSAIHESLSLCRIRAKATFGGMEVLAPPEEMDRHLQVRYRQKLLRNW